MLQREKDYEFKKRLLTIHPENIRDKSLSPTDGEYEIKDGTVICVPYDASDVIMTGAKDFLDYLLTSMDISAMISRKADYNVAAIIIRLEENQAEDYIITFGDVITVTAKNDRGAAQALYCLEDRMSARKAPFISKEEIRHTFMFSPRITQPGEAIFEFSNEHLSQIAHAGMDALIVNVKGVNLTPAGFLDFNRLCYRAAKYGIDVYAYSHLSCDVNPSEKNAQEIYDSIYGTVFKECPQFKGLILVGESIPFRSSDKRTYFRNIYRPTTFPSDLPHPGYWPCTDYPDWLEIIKKSVRKYNENVDIVFWSYNWGFQPEEDRITLINNLPKDVSLLVTYEMYEKIPREGITEISSDYTISFEGPGSYFTSEAEAAKKNGIRLYAMANTGGQTWDMGVIPYEPVPYQWMKRYKGLRDAQDKWGLCGLLESHHYGFFPSFIGDLSKQAFIKEETSLDESLDRVIKSRFGLKYTDKIKSALKKWSEAITHFTPSDDDQYGAFRVGPSYPFSLVKLRKPPSREYALTGNGLLKNEFPAGQAQASPPPTGRGMLFTLRVCDEIKSLEKMLVLMKEGVQILDKIPGENRNKELSYLINLGKFICCYVQTGINAKKWFRIRARLLSEERIDEFPALIESAEKLLLAERENATEAIDYVRLDSRLGWEPTMDYMCDEKAINWKISFIDYVLNTELKHFKNATDKKWLV